MYNDPQIGIDWRLSPEEIILSEKDLRNPTLQQIINTL
jgi:dTDP-4-dehydrorhamnose 3,5-epimerase